MLPMFPDGGVDWRPAPETEETNFIEPEPEPARDREPQPRAQAPNPPQTPDIVERNPVVSKEQMCKNYKTTLTWIGRIWEHHFKCCCECYYQFIGGCCLLLQANRWIVRRSWEIDAKEQLVTGEVRFKIITAADQHPNYEQYSLYLLIYLDCISINCAIIEWHCVVNTSSSHRYECPPGCVDQHGKVVGTSYYDMVTYQQQW